MIGKVTVRVSLKDNELPELLSDIKELHGLVPEWSSMEADELAERIFERISKLITTKSEV